jgi:WD40 repeat protein
VKYYLLKIFLLVFILIDFSISQTYRDIGTLAQVTSVCYNQTGTLIAAGYNDSRIGIWDLATGNLVRTFVGHTGVVTSVCFSPDGTKIASASKDNTIKIWEITSGNLLRTFTGHMNYVWSVKYSSDGSKIVSGSEDKRIIVWDEPTGNILASMMDSTGVPKSVSFNLGGSRIVSAGGLNKSVKVWDATNGNLVKVLTGHTGAVISVSYSIDGSKIVSGGEDQNIMIWDTLTFTMTRVLTGHTGSVRSVNFSPDGTKIVSGSTDKNIILWDVATGAQLFIMTGHTDSINCVAFKADGSRIVSGSSDMSIKFWDISTGLVEKTYSGHDNLIKTICYTPDGTKLISGSDDKTIKVWDVQTGALLKTFTGHTEKILAVCMSPDGVTIASCSSDNSIKLWDINSGNLIRTIPWLNVDVNAVAFSPDGTKLVAGNSDFTATIWNVSTGVLLKSLTGHTGIIKSVKFNLTGSHVITGSADNTAKTWDVNNGFVLRTLSGHTGSVNVVGYTPDGSQAYTGSSDRTIKVWDTLTAVAVKSLSGHNESILSVSFSPDGTTIISGSEDRTIKFWDATLGTLTKTISVDGNRPYTVAYNNNGTKFATTYVNKIRIYSNNSVTLSGNISQGGYALSDAAVLLYQNTVYSGLTHSDVNGNYSFVVDQGYDYKIVPQHPAYVFTPIDANLLNVTTDIVQNFTAAAHIVTISGIISLNTDGSPVAGVTLNLTGSSTGSVTTDAYGNYTINVVAGGNYTLTPVKTNYTFTPVSQIFLNVQATQMFNFTARLNTVRISGVITSNGSGLSGVMVYLSGSSTGTYNTDNTGAYTFTVGIGGNYTIKPVKMFYKFTPDSLSVNNIQSDQALNFTGDMVSYKITGVITSNGTGLSGVLLNLTGTLNGTTYTDGNGAYSFTVTPGGNYVVTPFKTNYTFTPASQAINNVTGDQVQNFTATLYTYIINGVVTLNSAPFSGVTITLSGSSTGTTTTDANGAFTFTVNAGGSYTITPSKTNYGFNPVNKAFTDLQTNQTQNFTANLLTYNIGGTIICNGSPLSGVILSLTDDAIGTTTSDINGVYSFSVLAGGTYTITPMKQNYSFAPVSQTFARIQGSEVLNFIATNTSVPEVPVLSSPYNYATGVPIYPTFSWNVYGNTISSDLQVATNANFGFSDIVYEINNITSNSYTTQILSYGTTYYWRVRARNLYGTSKYSTPWSFTTIPLPLTAPSLVSPANNSINVPTPTTLQWNPVSGAKDYVYQISEDYTFSTIKSAFSTGGAVSVVEYGLENNKTYYWRVRAEDATYQSVWSEVWNFKIVPQAPAVPVLISPPNMAILKIDYTNPLVTFTWNPANNATAYNVQVSTNANFTPLVAEFTDYPGTSCKYSVSDGRLYFWRVRGYNQATPGNWSEIWMFNSNLVGVKTLREYAGTEYQLNQNYPNPFNPETKIEYSIPENAFVQMKIYNTYGKEVQTLINQNQGRGVYQVKWEPNNMPSGVYYYRIQAGKYSEMKKMIYLR